MRTSDHTAKSSQMMLWKSFLKTPAVTPSWKTQPCPLTITHFWFMRFLIDSELRSSKQVTEMLRMFPSAENPTREIQVVGKSSNRQTLSEQHIPRLTANIVCTSDTCVFQISYKAKPAIVVKSKSFDTCRMHTKIIEVYPRPLVISTFYRHRH